MNQRVSSREGRLENRRFVLGKVLGSDWFNEGDPLNTPKGLYHLSFYDHSTLANVSGAIIAEGIKTNSKKMTYEFSGVVNSKGVIEVKLRIPLGHWGAHIGEAEFKYNNELDQVEYRFKCYIANTNMASEHLLIDTRQLLWRAPGLHH